MDEKLIKLALDLGENGLWAVVIYKAIDFLQLISFFAFLCFGIKWLFNKVVKELK